jgi:hypothetical protein
MKIHGLGAELFGADGGTDMKLIFAFRNFVNAPKQIVHGDFDAKNRTLVGHFIVFVWLR